MGNNFCPADDLSPLSSIARDVCPFPDYTPSPLFTNMLSINSSLHLRDHYTAVQSSLNPEQLEDFTQSLRRTFGREGRVSYGGVGVVALSLALLFDILAKEARGGWVPDSGPIPGLFFKDPRGFYPPHVYTISEYLRLVPHIANNPDRMREETERYMKRLTADEDSLETLNEKDLLLMYEDVVLRNRLLAKWFGVSLNIHLLRLTNGTANDLVKWPNGNQLTVLTHNLNCDLETADKELKARVERSDDLTQEAFRRYMTNGRPWPLQVAGLEWVNTRFFLACEIGDRDHDTKIAQREDFDLKANTLGKWKE
ncbi:uncharacterized protein LOC121519647 isoform X1 [Cheilinus undulatus]|uniref:uncharacterized protein LOC121519647 isoform X1 n=1 Tax=Cheilinus undulatus TaxID=241271 RepID=UPI001BD5A08A|nr:uncharacterized protein LOC121519647 isoform X1 [Cheilinus undulatus]